MKKILIVMSLMSLLVACGTEKGSENVYETTEDIENIYGITEDVETTETFEEVDLENEQEDVIKTRKDEVREEYKNSEKLYENTPEVGFWIYNGLENKTQIVYNREDGRTEVFEKDKYMYETADSSWELVSYGYWNGGNVENYSMEHNSDMYKAIYHINSVERIVEIQQHKNGDITKTDYIGGEKTRIYEKMNEENIPEEIK